MHDDNDLILDLVSVPKLKTSGFSGMFRMNLPVPGLAQKALDKSQDRGYHEAVVVITGLCKTTFLRLSQQ